MGGCEKERRKKERSRKQNDKMRSESVRMSLMESILHLSKQSTIDGRAHLCTLRILRNGNPKSVQNQSKMETATKMNGAHTCPWPWIWIEEWTLWKVIPTVSLEDPTGLLCIFSSRTEHGAFLAFGGLYSLSFLFFT